MLNLSHKKLDVKLNMLDKKVQDELNDEFNRVFALLTNLINKS